MADIISGKFGSGKDNIPSGNRVYLKKEDLHNGPSGDVFADELDDEKLVQKVKAHRKKRLMLIASVFAVVLVLFLVFFITYQSIVFKDYTVTRSVTREDSSSSMYVKYLDGYLRYSNDGASYLNNKGVAKWNLIYSMHNPQMKMCGETVAVGDINGTSIYIMNKNGEVGSIDTPMNIVQIEVAKQGVVAAVLEDTESNYINLYDSNGKLIYSVKSSISGDGYPMDICISEDATKLVVSYLYVSGESMKTNVVFYNFSDVGKNETERVVGGFNHYEDTIVADVEFMNSNTVVAVGENVLSVYKIKEYPQLIKEVTIDSQIQRVFFDDRHVGMIVLNNDDTDNPYKLRVYNLSGKEILDKNLEKEYDNIKFESGYIVMTNSSSLVMMNLTGRIAADVHMNLPLENAIVNGSKDKLIIINSKYVQNVNLK